MIAYRTVKAKKLDVVKGIKVNTEFDFNTYVYEASDLPTNAYFVSGSEGASAFVGKIVVLLEDAMWMLGVNEEALYALQHAEVLHIFFANLKMGITVGKTEHVIPLEDVGHLLHIDHEETNGVAHFNILALSEVSKWDLNVQKSL